MTYSLGRRVGYGVEDEHEHVQQRHVCIFCQVGNLYEHDRGMEGKHLGCRQERKKAKTDSYAC